MFNASSTGREAPAEWFDIGFRSWVVCLQAITEGRVHVEKLIEILLWKSQRQATLRRDNLLHTGVWTASLSRKANTGRLAPSDAPRHRALVSLFFICVN